MVMGAAPAPRWTVIEYASLTCPHCAAFNANTFSAAQERATIDQGLVKYIYRDFPLDRMALEAAKIAAPCAGPDKYFGLRRRAVPPAAELDAPATTPSRSWANLRRLAQSRRAWSDATLRPPAAKTRRSRMPCLSRALKGERELKVGSTPTLIINGQKHTGSLSFEDLDKVLKPLIGKS